MPCAKHFCSGRASVEVRPRNAVDNAEGYRGVGEILRTLPGPHDRTFKIGKADAGSRARRQCLSAHRAPVTAGDHTEALGQVLCLASASRASFSCAQLGASLSGLDLTRAPQSQITRTRNCAKHSSSFLMCASTRKRGASAAAGLTWPVGAQVRSFPRPLGA